MAAFDPYYLARLHVDRGDAVACVPVVADGQRSWAVLFWPAADVVPSADPNNVALVLIEQARKNLRAKHIKML